MTDTLHSPASPHWITTNEALAQHALAWLEQPHLALDTEFFRCQTFYAKPGLIQLATAEQVFFIDPLQVTDFEPLAKVLAAPQVIKVLHACSEDLEIFQQLTGTLPVPLFDTQLAAAFSGLGPSVGYQRLVTELLGIQLAKDETRSDWLQRPLSDAQITYAALDVHYLWQLYQPLLNQLNTQQRLGWLQEECQQLIEQAANPLLPENAYQQVKLAWKLRRSELAILRKLAAWREKEVRKRDIPRHRLLTDDQLWWLARIKPRKLVQLDKVRGIRKDQVAREGRTICGIIAKASAEPAGQWPKRLPKPLPKSSKPLITKVKKLAANLATTLSLPPELVIRKKQLEALIRSGLSDGHFNWPDNLQSWRRQLLGESLLAELRQLAKQQQCSTVMNKQIVSIYKSPNKDEMYLYAAKQAKLSEVPEALLQLFGKPEHVMDLLLTPEKSLARVEASQVMKDIDEKGFYLQMPPAKDDYLIEFPEEFLSKGDPV
ncbi:ribonuclease D [Spartinivicinus poritis]